MLLGINWSLYIAGFIYAWRSEPDYRAILRLVVILFIAGGALAVISNRMVFALDAGTVTSEFDNAIREGLAKREIDPDSPAGKEIFRQTLYSIVAMSTVVGLIVSHVLICLIIPWAVRDALLPTAAVWGIFMVVLAIDTARGMPLRISGAVVATSVIGYLPGLAICWFRYARFTRRLRLRLTLDQYRELQHDLFSARRLHESVLPPQKPDGLVRLRYAYEPMRHIGGDLLFVHKPGVDDPAHEVLHAVVLDVTGHGISAALTVNRLVGELQRLYAGRDPAPETILSALNEYVALTLADHAVYATACLLRVERNGVDGMITWAGGGHPPPLLTDGSDNGQCRRLDPQSPMLGVISPSEYIATSQTVPFGQDEKLIAYTDGANEAADAAGRQLQVEGLERIVQDALRRRPDDLPGQILARIGDYRRAPAADDTLIVVMQLG